MGISFERLQGVLFVKVNGITQGMYMPRISNESAFRYRAGILVIGILGWCVVFSPFSR